MAGYSGTPLLKKLGIKTGHRIQVQGEPAGYWDWLAPLPEGVEGRRTSFTHDVDFIHLFTKDRKGFEKDFLTLKKVMNDGGMLWVSWPKKSSGVATDLDENVIRNFGLAHGLVDVKVCAVDEVWSGLKFVVRLKDRKKSKREVKGKR